MDSDDETEQIEFDETEESLSSKEVIEQAEKMH